MGKIIKKKQKILINNLKILKANKCKYLILWHKNNRLWNKNYISMSKNSIKMRIIIINNSSNNILNRIQY